ncbi:MAG: Ig-like domain-containing protein, partial [Lachnospiraceae bacterium]|nr:Ig-like domain-containing protein [Lachnospiraceae bacterium]
EKTGRVRVGQDAEAGTEFWVIANSTDNSGVSGHTSFRVTSGKTVRIFVNGETDGKLYEPKWDNRDESLISARLFNEQAIPEPLIDISSLVLTASPIDPDGQVIDEDNMVSWTSSDPGIATVTPSDDGKSATVTAVPGAKGSVNITIAALDGSGKNRVVKINVEQPVRRIRVSGQSCIVYGRNGASATYTADAYPASANNKNVTWAINTIDLGGDVPEGVSINAKTGKVTIDGGADVLGMRFAVVATASYGRSIKGIKIFEVTDSKSTDIFINTSETAACYKPDRTKTGSLKSAQVFTTDIGDDEIDESRLTLWTQVNGEDPANGLVEWTSSNEKVATVLEWDQGKTAFIRGHAPGKTVITAKAMDGSGKSATVTVNVVVPVASLRLQAEDDMENVIGYGKTAKTVVSYGNAYGIPTEQKVVWDQEIYIRATEFYADTGEIINRWDADKTKSEWLKQMKLFTVKDGRVKAGSRDTYEECDEILPPPETEVHGERTVMTVYDFVTVVSAVAADGSGSRSEIRYTIRDAAKSIDMRDDDNRLIKTVTIALGDGNAWDISTGDLNEVCSYVKCRYSDGEYGFPNSKPVVTSSDPLIASAYYGGGGKLIVAPGREGTVTLTIRATDGSNVKSTLKVIVKGN